MSYLTVFDGGNTQPPKPRRPVAMLFHSERTVVRVATTLTREHEGREYRIVLRDRKVSA